MSAARGKKSASAEVIPPNNPGSPSGFSSSSKRSLSFVADQNEANRKKVNTDSKREFSDSDEGLSVPANTEVIELSSGGEEQEENNDSDFKGVEPANDPEDDIEEDSDEEYDSRLKKFHFSPVEDEPSETHKKIYELDPLPPLSEIKITRVVCSEARSYLKVHGHMQFLGVFVPEDPSANDILLLINLLGFVPKSIDKVREAADTEDNFMRSCVIFLQEAINRVSKTRTRLPNFYKLEHLYDALNKAKKVLVLTGAGISTSLGIPDFRSSQGFYSKMANLGLDDPQDVFSLEVFRRDPNIFYSIAHMILPPDYAYTPLHGFIKLLQDKGKLLRNYAQNIDNLEANAGVTPDNLVQCHGSFATASCFTCKYKVHGDVIFPYLRRQQISHCPFCTPERKFRRQQFEKLEDEGNYSRKFENIDSFGVMKPDITFFGEDLPERYHSCIKKDVLECDLLLCIGTSLKVAPVSEIVNMLPKEVPQILINRDPIDHAEFDIELLGYCDEVITWLCTKLDWKINHKDFEKIAQSGLEVETLDENSYAITDANQRNQ